MPKLSKKIIIFFLALCIIIPFSLYLISTKDQSWRTYRDKQYSFELKHPKDSQLQKVNQTEYFLSITGPRLNYRLFICPDCTDIIDDTVEIVKAETVQYPHFSAQHMVVIMEPEKDPEYQEDYLVISTPKHTFWVSYFGDQNTTNQILSSLKFDLL